MAKDIPDYLREYDLDQDWGFTPVSKAPETPTVDTKVIEDNNVELAKVKSDVSDIKSMMNEIMQIVAEKETVTKELESADVTARFKEAEKLIKKLKTCKILNLCNYKNVNFCQTFSLTFFLN